MLKTAVRHKTADLRFSIRGCESSESRRGGLNTKSNKAGLFLCRVLVSLIVVLLIGFLGLGVRAFATADATQFIFSAASVVSVATLVLYFMLLRPARELTVHSMFAEPLFVKRFLLPHVSTLSGNPLTLDHLSERRSAADLAVGKVMGDSLMVSL